MVRFPGFSSLLIVDKCFFFKWNFKRGQPSKKSAGWFLASKNWSEQLACLWAFIISQCNRLNDFFTCPIFGRSLIQVIFPKYLCHSSLYNCILHRTLRHLHSELHVVTWRDRSFGIREKFTEWVFEKVNGQINVLHAYSRTSLYWMIGLYIGILK